MAHLTVRTLRMPVLSGHLSCVGRNTLVSAVGSDSNAAIGGGSAVTHVMLQHSSIYVPCSNSAAKVCTHAAAIAEQQPQLSNSNREQQ